MSQISENLAKELFSAYHWSDDAGLGLHGRLYPTGNNGSLTSAEKAHKLLLHTLQSSPVNSLHVATQLSSLPGEVFAQASRAMSCFGQIVNHVEHILRLVR